MLRTILRDFVGLARVCGWGLAFRWLWKIAVNFKACVRARNLQPADRALGVGPFRCRRGKSTAMAYGEGAISGVRELWVRSVYLAGDFLTISPDAKVVDLGANMGNFTLLALGHGPGVKVVAVEGCEEPLAKLRKSIAANGWENRVQICQKFIGGVTRAQEEFPEVQQHTVDFISEQGFVDRYGVDQIDFLKCDIEGSEFDLLKPGSLLLGRARQLAIELHAWAGDMDGFVRMLEDQGFETRIVGGSEHDRIVQARKRVA